MKDILKKGFILLTCGLLLLTGCQNSISTETNQNIDSSISELSSNLENLEFVEQMNLGWNLGDTLDVCNADRNGDGILDENSTTVDETLWGNPMTAKELFQTLKDDGIDSVRIPITWRDHLDENNTIDEYWLNRVQEVVDYAYNLDMFVIINIHHDGGGDPNFGAWIRNASTNKEAVFDKYVIIWNQIAERFKDYSQKLIFESMNEVGFDDLNQRDAYLLLNEFNQTFVDLIRNSGGNNPNRYLLIAGYWTDIDMTINNYFVMPNDFANKCIVSVHYYTPWEFCTTNINKTWGSDSDIKRMEQQIQKLIDRFINSGIPVIVGEYGVGYGTDVDSQVLFCETFVKLCHDNGIPTFLWDNGQHLNRDTYDWQIPQILEALQSAIE